MASIITATVASGLTQQADNSGVLQLASGTGNLVTVPSVTGTAMVSGNMPAFSVYSNTNQTVSSGVITKITLNTEVFDTANCFDSTTNYRFTPNVAGYYSLTGSVLMGNGSCTQGNIYIYKNGSTYVTNYYRMTGSDWTIPISSILYLNGSTDYVELYAVIYGGTTLYGSQTQTQFCGVMVRGA